jgi:hypothetical protein
MSFDPNKRRRDEERRLLHRNGWVAVTGLKRNGAEKWVWIHPGRKRALSREQAVAIAKRSGK